MVPLCLPIPTNEFMLTNKSATAIGFGRTEQGKMSKILLEANLTVKKYLNLYGWQKNYKLNHSSKFLYAAFV